VKLQSEPTAPIEKRWFEARLDDGTPILFRTIRPDDKDRLAGGFERLSEESRYRRFFRQIDHLSSDQLRYLTEIDFRDHFAWIAVLTDEPGQPGVGVGRWVRIKNEPEVAEAAVTVVDDFHNRGIGKTLLFLSAFSAVEKGVRWFRAWALGDNQPILGLLKEMGARPGRWESGVMELMVPLPASVADLDMTPAPLILKAVAAGTIAGRARRTAAGTTLDSGD
jgi:hypothetical protein